jgi:2-C-methyl-D-erythritol 4-phosphate cytidylyltransferase / 2-C-methyl-D-erythritol 2,4-cyclodiphosphate synthase
MTRILQPRIYLAVLAGGQSLRARRGDSSAPKQFREVGGQMLFLVSLRELLQAPGVVRAVVVVPDAWRPLAAQALAEAALPVACALAAAGEHRTASAWNALQSLAELPESERPEPYDLVAVHDAARPFASRHLLARVAKAAARHGAAVPGVAVTDTVVRLAAGDAADEAADEATEADGAVAETCAVATYLERRRLVAVQTPQVCRWRELHAAHAWAASANLSFTDDGGLVAARGLSPTVVMGERENWKVTTEEDWERTEGVYKRRR